MSILQNISNLKEHLPEQVRLVVVSKTQSVESILEAYQAGQRVFGENKVQELLAKQPALPDDIEWHLIGHLQTNKVRHIAPFIDMIESVDSLRLLAEINLQAEKLKRVISCLLQFHIAKEESKFGLDYEQAVAILDSDEYSNMSNVKIAGVMGMATFTSNIAQVREEFRELATIYIRLKQQFFAGDNAFKEISMGMSDDYPIAIEEGSTNVRIGTLIFGERLYT